MTKKLRDIVEAVHFWSHKRPKYELATRNRFEKLKSTINYDNPDHQEALQRYAVGSTSLHNHLVHGEEHSPEFMDYWGNDGEYEKHLSSAIKANQSPRKMIVYHGAGFDPSKFPKGEDGKHILHNKGYLSTSTGFDIAQSFSNAGKKAAELEHPHVLRIHIPKGARVGVMHHPDTAFDAEKEVIIHKGHKLLIDPKPIEVTSGGRDINVKHKVWNAHLVHDGTNE